VIYSKKGGEAINGTIDYEEAASMEKRRISKTSYPERGAAGR
jgi:hypothetical protein